MLGMYFLEKGIWNESLTNQKVQFEEAHKYFKKAAENLHLLATYQLAVMHWTGLGTFQSCDLAKAYFK